MKEPYVGIIVNDNMYDWIPRGQTKHEAVHFYVEAGKRYGVTPCFFRLQDWKPGIQYVDAYVSDGNGFVKRRIKAPAVIHNRAIYQTNKEYRQLESWERGGVQVFNRWNRFSKLLIHETLMKEPSLRPHLPGTYPATIQNIRSMMRMYDEIIIKPDRSSVGRGVMKLERTPGGWLLTYPASMQIGSKTWKTARFRNVLPPILRKRIAAMDYIVQQRLPLATYDDRPFDMRVSVQRNATGDWQITGVVAKVAKRAAFLTNVAQGGTVHKLETLLAREYPHLNGQKVMSDLSDFALNVAKHLSRTLPHLADVGLDVGISTGGFPMFIECNGKDQRYSFREAGMLEEWKATYYNPIAYAKFLLDGGEAVLV